MMLKTLHMRSALVVAFALLAILPGPARMFAQAGAQRVVQGKVTESNDQPVAGAIVYLKDMRKLTIKSFISTPDGNYRFGQLSPDTDYEIWADLKGRKSSTKTVSSFDTKKVLDLNLKLK
jgi:Carboxypeptidase regulatory-like domain